MEIEGKRREGKGREGGEGENQCVAGKIKAQIATERANVYRGIHEQSTGSS